MRRNHTLGQRLNYFKFKFSKRREVLNYEPVTISIVATGRCTLSCDMCPTHSRLVPRDYPHIQKNSKDIDFTMFKEIIDRFKNALEVHIIGSGEPLLNKDFFRMVDYAASKNMIVKSFSNGTTIEENMSKILDSRLDGITISINGHSAEEFKRMTGMDGEVYRRIYGATKKLIEERNRKKSKVRIKLSYIIDKSNYRFIPEMIKTSEKIGADHTFLCNFLQCPYEGLNLEARSLEVKDDVIRDIKKIAASLPNNIRKKVTFPTLVDTSLKKISCDTHFSQIRFDGDGNVSSCSMMLLDMTGHGYFKDRGVWNNEFFKAMRRRFLSSKEALPEPCLTCPDNFGVYPW